VAAQTPREDGSVHTQTEPDAAYPALSLPRQAGATQTEASEKWPRALPEGPGASRSKVLLDAANAGHVAAGPSDDKPEKVVVHVTEQTRAPFKGLKHRAARADARHWTTDADEELANVLRLKALYVPRSASLRLRLKAAAEQYLRKFDKGALAEPEYVLINRAVCAAMDITEEEEYLRQHMKNNKQEELRLKQAKMSATGELGGTRTLLSVVAPVFSRRAHKLPAD